MTTMEHVHYCHVSSLMTHSRCRQMSEKSSKQNGYMQGETEGWNIAKVQKLVAVISTTQMNLLQFNVMRRPFYGNVLSVGSSPAPQSQLGSVLSGGWTMYAPLPQCDAPLSASVRACPDTPPHSHWGGSRVLLH